MVIDPEITRENPVEAKHRRLVRSHRSGPLDRELKPNAKIRDELSEIVAFPPTQELAAPQRDLLWQFRFYLTRDKRALTKFLKSVVWTDPGEVKQAVEVLLPMWAEVEMDDALELLGPSESFRDGRVRAYAVQQLGKVDDDELMLYLLQLVQALKFETTPVTTPSNSMRQSRHSSSRFAIAVDDSLPTLEGFLIERSARNPVLGNHFRWYIAVECEDKQRGKMFVQLAKKFNAKVAELHVEGEPDQLDLARRQQDFIQRISQLAKDLRASKDARPKKIERLKAVLSDSKAGLGSFAPIRLPLDAKVEVIGIDPDKSSVFKSNLFPLRLHLLTSEAPNASPPSSYAVIFKNGDDLRQDQLVIQLFTLMDRLLRKENLDLKLMPYRVLATGAVDGMVQFVASRTLQDISNEYAGGLLAYLREMHPDPGSVGTMGVKAEVMDTYVRSCAGYCVVTYLLGVGDRHLDNLLLSPDGHFFHGKPDCCFGSLHLQPRANPFRSIFSFCRSRLWLHPRTGPQAVPAGGQGVQGDGRLHGRRQLAPLRALQVALLHGFHDATQEQQPDHQPRRPNGRRQYPRHPDRARQGCRQGPGQVPPGRDRGGGRQSV